MARFPTRKYILLSISATLFLYWIRFYFETIATAANTPEIIGILQNTYWKWIDIAAHPWLIPNHSTDFLFVGLHNDIEKLLAIMSDKTNNIALLRFNYPWQEMLENQIYTLVKFGRVYNYIVMAGDEKSLSVCFELKLPCLNGTKYFKAYYPNIDPAIDALISDRKHYRPLNWFKLRFFLDVLKRNYTIIAFDTDIAFSRKDIWKSLEKYSMDAGDCDMVFMKEHPVNAGFLYSKPSFKTITLFERWIDMEYSHGQFDEQRCFGLLRGFAYEICDTKDECDAVRVKKMISLNINQSNHFKSNLVTVRRFPSSYIPYSGSHCPNGKKMDPCLNTSLFVHPICMVGQKRKVREFTKNGFWMMKQPCTISNVLHYIQNNSAEQIEIHRCTPKSFLNLTDEIDFEKCQNLIAWT